MGLDKPYLDIPGTTIFDADQARKGYHLNQFAMSKTSEFGFPAGNIQAGQRLFHLSICISSLKSTPKSNASQIENNSPNK